MPKGLEPATIRPVRVLKILQGVFLIVAALVLSVVAFLVASAFKWANELPDLRQLDTRTFTATTRLYARDGTQIGEILPAIGTDRETTNRIPVSLHEVSPALLQAIVAYEDDDFFRHYGFGVLSIAKAFYEEFFGDEGRGGSTITTQVIKNELLRDIATDRSLERKAKELMLAVQLERRLTKQEILQRYINVVFWGGQVYGVRAAAEAYFGVDPIELTLAQSLYLARLIPAPNLRYNDDFRLTRASIRNVLDRMVSTGAISEETADRAWREEIQPRGWSVTYDGQGNVVSAERVGNLPVSQTTLSSNLSDYIVVAARNWLLERYGDDIVYGRGGLRVFTTIDVQAQRAANEASLNAEAPEGAQLAIVGIDPETGAVLAMVGGRLVEGERPGEFNRALQTRRQPGSSFKPVVYATAIEQIGFSQATVLVDERTQFRQPGQPNYVPDNHNRTFEGAATLRYHLNVSRNIPAVLALEAATAEAVAARARELGYGDVPPFYSISLGALDTNPLTHAAAFGSFANEGVKMDPYFIERVEDAEGNVLFEAVPRGTRVWSPETAYIVLDMMGGNVQDGGAFGRRAQIPGRWVGGKTGTTNDERDIWFIGMTPGMVATVWIGYDDNRPIPKTMPAALTEAGDGQVNSSRQPVYIWRDFVEAALRGKPSLASEFPVPEGIVFRNFDLRTGIPSSSGVRGAFLANQQLGDSAMNLNWRLQIPIDTTTGKRATANTPRENIEYRDVRADDIARYLD